MKDIKHTVANSVLRVLKPLVRLLLRHEISHSEFSELAKRAYVDVAYHYFSIPNRKKTYARVAVLTGLNLKEVRRVSTAEDDALLETKGPVNRAKQVVSGWLRDEDFIDEEGKPKVLPLKGGVACFEELVMRYSGNITSRAILDELLRVGAVLKTEEDTLELVQEGLIPKKSEQDMVDIITQHNSDLMNTGLYNLTHEKDAARFQRQVAYTNVPESVIEEFRLYSSEKSLELLKDFDRWLAEKSKEENVDPNEETGRVGVGVYYFRNEKKEG